MDNTTIYRDAFAPYRQVLIEQGTSRLRRIFAYSVNLYGHTLKGIYNDRDLARTWSQTMCHVTRRESHDIHSPVSIDESALSAFVAKWADSELESAVEKLALKVGNLDNVTVVNASGAGDWFTVTGTRANGDNVRIVQNQTINVSSHGKLFNQWPALIYVNGKKVSEAQFKRMDD